MTALILMSYIFWLADIQTIDSLICLKWNINRGQLILTCQVYPLDLSVSFYDPQMTERALCFMPIPTSYCVSTHWQIFQNLTNGNTVLSFNVTFDFNGKWKCLQGRDSEQATAVVRRPTERNFERLFPAVNLRVPKYTKRNQDMLLNCEISGDVNDLDKNVTLLVNDQPFVKLAYSRSGCQKLKYAEGCKESDCHCSEDGTDFVVRYTSPIKVGANKYSCNIEIGSSYQYADCVFSEVVDMGGLNLKSSLDSPVRNGTYIDLVCFVKVSEYHVKLKWNCLNFTNDTIHNTNDGYFVSSIQVLLNSSNNYQQCSCTVLIGDWEIESKSIDLLIHKEPVLLKTRDTKCQRTYAVTITCSIVNVNEFVEYGYSLWTHSQHGQFVRQLPGVMNGDVNVLHIWNCRDTDNGEYTCSAWGSYSGIKVWSNTSVVVTVEDSNKQKSFSDFIPYTVSGSVALVVIVLFLVVLLKRNITGNYARETVIYHAAQADQPVNSVYLTTNAHYEEIENIPNEIEQRSQDEYSDKTVSGSPVNDNEPDYLDPC